MTPMKDEFTDETLMAFVDGELGPDDSERVERALELDETLRKRVDAFALTGRDLGELFAQPLHEPVPEALLQTVQDAAARREARIRSEGWLGRMRESLAGLMTPPAMMATGTAAAAVVAIGLGFSVWGPETPTGEQHALLLKDGEQLWARGALLDALETTVSGDSKPLAETEEVEGSVLPVLTFKDKAGRFCREYAVAGTADANALGIACRESDGRWEVEIHAAQAKTPETGDTFKPASGTTAGHLQAVVDDMIAGEPLSLDQEEGAIGAGWK